MIEIALIVYVALTGVAVLCNLPRLRRLRYAFKKPPHRSATEMRRISVVIPARNESESIGALLSSLLTQDYDPTFFDVNIIVQDEADPTVPLAKEAGASVFVVPEQRCKGDALDGYFQAISIEKRNTYAAFVIIDADAVLENNYITELNNALEYDCHIYTTRKCVKNYLGLGKRTRSVFSDCAALTWPIIDDLGNNYRTHVGIPLNLCGQGLMVRREVIEELGGWPYRTLTEDYELKLDSILRGFRSMFYPHAVLYTEEALRHSENFSRRLRWLTGYSQCDKKYKKIIRAQAKKRGTPTSGELEYLFGIFPLIFYAAVTAICMLYGSVVAVVAAARGSTLWIPALLLLVLLPFGVLYLLLFLYGALAMLACPEMFAPLKKQKKLAALLYNPLYLLEYVPIFVMSRVTSRKVGVWKQTSRINYGEE